jgi:hypothetical protein
LISPGRLDAAPDHGKGVDGLRQKQHLLRVVEGDGLIANRHIVPHDDDPAAKGVTALSQHGDLDVDRPSEAPLYADDVLGAGIHPEAFPRCHVSRPVEAVVVPVRVAISSALLVRSTDAKSIIRAIRFLSFAIPAALNRYSGR